MGKTATIIVIIAIILLALLLLFSRQEAPAPQETTLGPDNTTAINQDLESINISDLDSEFEDINAEIENL